MPIFKNRKKPGEEQHAAREPRVGHPCSRDTSVLSGAGFALSPLRYQVELIEMLYDVFSRLRCLQAQWCQL